MMNQKELLQKLSVFETTLQKQSRQSLGYPANQAYDYASLFNFFHFSLNNIGDPFVESTVSIHSKPFEREVLEFFANLYDLSNDAMWGYVTSGGTEGNMYGLFLGRELYPNGILYFSEDTHYSVLKIARLLNMKYIQIGSQDYGEIDYDNLSEMIKINRKDPVIMNLNVGTTMKGAIDNVDRILAILDHHKVSNYHIHCDAALFGMILPFLDSAPTISFNKPIGSVSISGHKFIGSPIPCGVVLTKKTFVQQLERRIEYIRTLDTTILGSRNGHTPLILWYAINSRGKSGFKAEAISCLRNAKYLYEKLEHINYPCIRNEFSNIVYFQKPSKKLIKKWQLPTQDEWAHIIAMQHICKSKIDAFVNDIEVYSKSKESNPKIGKKGNFFN